MIYRGTVNDIKIGINFIRFTFLNSKYNNIIQYYYTEPIKIGYKTLFLPRRGKNNFLLSNFNQFSIKITDKTQLEKEKLISINICCD